MAYFRTHPIPITEWLKCAKIEAFLAAMRAREDGLPDWRRIGRDFPGNFRKSRTNRRKLRAPSSFPLIADKNGIFPDASPVRYQIG